MSKEKRRVPKLRFPGFTEDWEQRKLIYIFNDFIVPMRDKPKVFSGTTPWTRIEDIEGRYINTSLSGQFVSDETIKSMNLKVIPKGSLIVSASATFGVVAIVNNDLITNQTFIGLVPNKDFDIDFLYSLFEAPTTKDKLLKLSAGSTIFYISRESFENLVLSVPSKEEQIKISKVFKSIDDSITLHQRKLDNLKLKKKALLQKLFPKNGERYPELRFPEFTDAWEQREFSDIFAEVKSGLSRMLSNDDIGLPVVRANNINDGQLNLVDDIKYWYKNDPQGANTNNYLIEQGDILINFINSEAKMGTAAYVTRRPERDTIYTTNILRCKVNDEYNPYFIYSLTFLNSYKNYIASITKPAVNQASFTTVDFKKYSIKIPTVKEQNQIADLIETFNKLITLHQRKLDHLQLQKKALLQQMFV